jgi:LmbE family N-acetylglucosaminyl deacetylase
VLCLGAHSDDIEIGCGATLLALLADCQVEVVDWVVLAARGARGVEARASAEALIGHTGKLRLAVKEFRDGFLPFEGAAVKEYFEELGRSSQPDLIFTHYRQDRHQDHRLVSDLTWNTFRNHLILEYEIPKYDGDLGQPNCFVPVTAEFADRKVNHLMSAFASQRDKRWFTPSTFHGLMRLRGIEAGAGVEFAEAFHARKWLMRGAR